MAKLIFIVKKEIWEDWASEDFSAISLNSGFTEEEVEKIIVPYRNLVKQQIGLDSIKKVVSDNQIASIHIFDTLENAQRANEILNGMSSDSSANAVVSNMASLLSFKNNAKGFKYSRDVKVIP